MNTHRLAVLIAAAALFALMAGCGHSSHRVPPIALDGVGGAKLFMTPEQVKGNLKLTSPLYVNFSSDSSAWAYMPICVGKTYGGAIFFGPASTDYQDHSSLEAVWFQSGEQTDAGVQVGSTTASLRRAYGRQLQHPDPYDFAIVGSPRRIGPFGQSIRPAIVFSMFKGKVTAIGFGTREQILANGQASVPPDVVCH